MNGQKYKEILHLHENEDFTEYRREDNKASFFEKRSEGQIELNSGLQKKVPDGFVLVMRSLKNWRRKNSCIEIAKG